jgi:hypothetical protein
VTVESCGKSRVLIGGLAEDRITATCALYRQMCRKAPEASDDDYDYFEEEEADDEE